LLALLDATILKGLTAAEAPRLKKIRRRRLAKIFPKELSTFASYMKR